jgi:hypothetical protein
MTRARLLAPALVSVLLLAPAGRGDEPFRYPEAKHGKGELKYRGGLPVLTVEGTPEEIGEQVGALAVKPAAHLYGRLKEFLRAHGLERAYPLLLRTAGLMTGRFPPDHLKEIEAMAQASGLDRDLLLFGNAFNDLRHLGGCSVLVVEPPRSATGGPLFGRNLDWPPVLPLNEYSLVTVYRPKGKHAFAAVGLPGLAGCITGMNDAGLVLSVNTSGPARDGSAHFDARGVPSVLANRLLLEECVTVAEAERAVRKSKRAGPDLLTLCDRKVAAVLEVTPSRVAVRRSEEGICACTNHFRTAALAVVSPEELAAGKNCRRYRVLARSREMAKLGLADVAAKLHAVNQGRATMQTMIFEPAALRLHLAIGRCPTSALPLRPLDLAPLLAAGPPAAAEPGLRLLVPAYFYPAGDGVKQWDRLIAAAARAPILAVVNPASGPGQKADPAYARLMERAKGKPGLTLLGYVDTTYGKRPAADVRADMDRWLRLYPQIQGVFFDQQASAAGQADYYAALYQYVRTERRLRLVVTNPGTTCAEVYLARPATDVACLFESGAGFAGFRPPPWAGKYGAARFAALAYGVGDAGQMRKYLGEAAAKGLGHLYVTDTAGANPWARLPAYWDDEVAAVQALNRAKAR